MTDKPISLAARRWQKSSGPETHSVREMLEAAIARLNAGEIEASHAILNYGREADGEGFDGYMQAGDFGPFAQIGLLNRGLDLISQGDD